MANYFNKNKLFSDNLSKRVRSQYIDKMNVNLFRASVLFFLSSLLIGFATYTFVEKYKSRDVFINYTNGKVNPIVVSEEDKSKMYEAIKQLRSKNNGAR